MPDENLVAMFQFVQIRSVEVIFRGLMVSWPLSDEYTVDVSSVPTAKIANANSRRINLELAVVARYVRMECVGRELDVAIVGPSYDTPGRGRKCMLTRF
jgi:hypothetical protein